MYVSVVMIAEHSSRGPRLCYSLHPQGNPGTKVVHRHTQAKHIRKKKVSPLLVLLGIFDIKTNDPQCLKYSRVEKTHGNRKWFYKKSAPGHFLTGNPEDCLPST